MPFEPRQAARWAGGTLPFAAFAAAGPFLDPFVASMLSMVFLFAFLGQAWNLIFGFAGQLSLGHALFAWAIEEARREGCSLVQLTSDKRRANAHRFYGRLGFVASHEGFKLHLSGE